ncbi:DUF2884 family protein [Dyella sp. 2HG41-7]|uniref:DUF2884 family protein n=1 Tax=Dyella sp. 2HG41-7 TaxID=2883239 RepID=UPI001F25EA3E|nr:DUF2884 family protein [Dyella sp. 2HG41-7]
MRVNRWQAAWVLMLAGGCLHAQDLSTVCHATSSYDLTVQPSRLTFDRASPAPTRVVIGSGSLQTDGQAVSLNAEDQDRVALFLRETEALVPRVKAVVQRGVDIAVQAIQQESATLNLDDETRVELQRRLQTDASNLHQRVAASESTHDWHGDAANQYANQLISDIAPLIAGSLGQQAITAAMSGDLQQAAALRDQASNLASGFQPRLQQRLQVLRPDIQALCPDIQRLSALQEGLRASNGRPLNLIQVGQ